MGEEAYDETVLAADTGTLTIRGGYGRKKVWLGIHAGNEPEGTPEMGIFLTPRQQKTLVEAIGQMTFHAIQDLVERLNIASSALEKLAMGHAFTAGEEGEKWMRGVAESALEEIER